jgi:hypothetical protein
MKSVCDEEMTIIQPATMTFLYRLSHKECNKKLTGECSLERETPDRTHDVGDEADYDYCPEMLERMTGQLADLISRNYPITLVKHSCGHYSFSDGQHRTCIAQRKGLEVAAVILPDNEVCDYCDVRRRRGSENFELR